MSKGIISNARWWIAELFDKSQSQCWADLVMWAQYGESHYRPPCPVTSMCFDGPSDTCYCGKLPRPVESSGGAS